MALNMAIKQRYEMITKTAESIKKKLKKLPEGRIAVKHRNNNTRFYLVDKGTAAKYLNKSDAKLIEDLIQKNYLEEVLSTAEQEAVALRKVLEHYPAVVAEEIYSTLSSERQAIAKPIVLSDEEYANKWLAQPYKRKSSNKDYTFVTLKGDHVRSKSELVIADRLWANGIPYKYECPLLVGNEIIHPDFSILRMSDRKIVYLEHCGKMDDPNYTEDMVKRVNLYSQEKIFQGDRLFFSFESSTTPLNTDVLDDMIRTNFI